MGNCWWHLWGSNSALAEMVTEEKIGQSLVAKLDATSTTYEALHRWELAYVEDIRGNSDRATDHYDDAIKEAGDARAAWKTAEHRQTELLTHLTSLPKDAAIRPEVRDELDKRDERDHLTHEQSLEQFPAFIDVSDLEDMVAFGGHLLDIDPDKLEIGQVYDSEDDEVWYELMSIFTLDLHQVRRMKIVMDEVKRTFEEHRSDVVEAKLYESLGNSLTRDRELYPVSEATSRARIRLVAYIIFVEGYGSYITRALMEAGTDMPDEYLEEYVSQS